MDEQSRSFERIEADADFRGSSDDRYQQRTYRVAHHEGFMEQALPSQYHATMKVATNIPPTSLRGIQHMSQKTEQAAKLIFSLSTFKPESDNFDDDLDLPTTHQALADHLETLETDILEMEEIKHCNLSKVITDQVNGSKKSLLYSREIPTKSMEIHNIPFNNRGQGDQVNWHRYYIYQMQDEIQIVIEGIDDPHFLYQLRMTQDKYLDLQKAQSISTCFSDFAKRLSTLLDYCILQLHTSSEVKSRFTCILNEHENQSDVQTMYICEQNEFRKLVHLELRFERCTEQQRAEMHYWQAVMKQRMLQVYLKQKMILIQKSRDGCQAMLEINESLKMLKEENTRVIEEVKQKHQDELDAAEQLKSDELNSLNENHSREMTEIVQANKIESDNFKKQISDLNSQLSSSKTSFEKEQIITSHLREENSKLKDQVNSHLSEIQDLREKLTSSQSNLTSLEKEKITLTMDNERKDSTIETLEESLKDLKQKLLADSSDLQQLKIDHTKLQQVCSSQKDSIEQLTHEISQITDRLSLQSEETNKYKDKKSHFKESFKTSEDEVAKLKGTIAELERSIKDLEQQGTEKDEKFSEKMVVIEALQSKLKETQVTLLSNNTTIDELKTSLAEAQKYSFRAILNNRSSAHHPPAPPVGYQGTFQGQQQQSLSQYLKTNDKRQTSNSRSPIRLPDHQSTMTQQPIQTLQSKTYQVSGSKVDFSHQVSASKADHEESSYITSQRVAMPLTEYYANKFSSGGGTGGFSRPMRTFAEPALQNLDNENSFMMKAQEQMRQRQESSNQFAKQLERDQLASAERLNGFSRVQPMTRVESKQSAMFGANQRSSAAVSENHMVVDDQKIEQELQNEME